MAKDLVVKVGANISDFEKKMAGVSAKMQDLGKKMQDVGKSMSMYVTAPIVAMGAASVMAFNKQEAAEKKLRAALQANGQTVDITFAKYKSFASEMQRLTVVGDEVTLEMLQVAESMGLTGDAAMRAVKNSISMQEAFGVNAQAAIRMTSALEQGDATMLTRYIPALRGVEDQTERAALAQDILSKSFNIATENAKTGQGAMIQMKNAVGDLMEQFGGIISEAITPFVVKIKELAERFQNLDDRTKKIIVVIGGLAAVIGPLLISLGFLIGTIVPALIAAGPMISAAWLPLTAIVLGLAGAIYLFNQAANETHELIKKLAEQSTEELTKRLSALDEQIDLLSSDRLVSLKKELAANAEKLNAMSMEERLLSPLLQQQADLIKQIRIEEQLYSDNYSVIKKYEEERKAILRLLADRNKLKEPPTTPEERARVDIPDKLEPLIAPKFDVEGIRVSGEEMREALKQPFQAIQQDFIDLTGFITGAMIDAFDMIGTAIGATLTGKNFGMDNFLLMMADWAKKLGGILVAAGLAIFGFKAQALANPLALVGLGGALIAAGAAVKAAVSSNPATGVNTSYGGAQSGGTVEGIRDWSQLKVAISGELYAEGTQLKAVLDNETTRQNL